MADSIGVRIQGLEKKDQVLVLARLAESRSPHREFGPQDVGGLFHDFGLPAPAKVVNYFGTLGQSGMLSRRQPGRWCLTPLGRARSVDLASDMDLRGLQLEVGGSAAPALASTVHPVVPPSLAPPDLITPLSRFFKKHPFDTNTFAMTRFPSDDSASLDPMREALDTAREACGQHGLELHLASDRQIVDDLWANVAAHMWGCRYAIAFYEDRTGEGLNYNLNIEVGSCLVLGRRLAILKDVSAAKLPTDLVGKIYKEIDLDDAGGVGATVHGWIRDDLSLGACSSCGQY